MGLYLLDLLWKMLGSIKGLPRMQRPHYINLPQVLCQSLRICSPFVIGLDYGLLLQRVDVDGEMLYTYSWRERRPEGWQLPTSGKDLFAEQQMPPEIELHLELENVPVAELSLGGGEVEAPPQVVLYASGETTPGAIEVRRRDNSELLWRVEWDLLGRFELLRRGEVEEAL
jgi:general secretion pathway protein H